MKAALAVVVGVLAATGFTACGDGDEGPSKPEYVEKADALCAAADEKVDAAFQSVDRDEPKPAEAQAALEQIVPTERKLVADLRELEAPEDDRDEIERMLAAFDRGVKGLEAASRDPEASVEFIQAETPEGPWGEASRLAQGYGLVDCGESPPNLGGQPNP